MADGLNRAGAVAAVAAAVVAFAGGIVVGRASPGAAPGAPQGSAPESAPWSLFGKPRAANAARPAGPKPAGFAVWTTRLDTSGPEALSCIR